MKLLNRAVFPVLLLCFSFATKAQKSSDIFIGIGINQNQKIEISHNPLNALNHKNNLESKATTSGSISLGLTLNHTQKISSDFYYMYARAPYKVTAKFDFVDSNSKIQQIEVDFRDNIIRTHKFQYSLNYKPFNNSNFFIKNTTINIGMGLGVIKTFKSTYNARSARNFPNDSTLTLDFSSILFDSPGLKPNTSDGILKHYIIYDIAVKQHFNNPKSTLSVGILFSPSLIGYGGFEFRNIPYTSEGLFNLKNNMIHLEYRFYLNNLAPLKKYL